MVRSQMNILPPILNVTRFPLSVWEWELGNQAVVPIPLPLGLIDLFRLYILFSQYRSRDDTQKTWSLALFIKKSACRHIHVCFNEQDKGSNLLSIITWSVLGRQNVQAKKVYCSAKFKNTINLPQLISVKASEWRFFNLESLVPGRPQNASFSKIISLIGVSRFLDRKR